MAETLVIPQASQAAFPNPALAEIYDPEAFSAHDSRWPSERYARRPVADELLNVMALLLGGCEAIRVRNNTGSGMTAGQLVYVSAFAGIIEEGDASSQCSSWVVDGVTMRNTSLGRLWWKLTNVSTTRTVQLYRHVNQDGTFPSSALVASGTRTGDGSVTLTQENSSGISGSVTVAYTVDDTDSANLLYLDVHDITLADADATASLAQYVLLAAINTGSHGAAYRFGEVTGLDTSGATAAGSLAYLSNSAGGFGWTTGTFCQPVGICTRKDASNGRILFMLPGLIRPTFTSLADVNTTGLAAGYMPTFNGTTKKFDFSAPTDTDEKVKAASGDSTAGYLDAKVDNSTIEVSSNQLRIKDAGTTYAKIQNVSATDKVLGRVSSGAGSVEEIACTAAGRALIDDADAAAQRTTLGLSDHETHTTGDTLTDAESWKVHDNAGATAEVELTLEAAAEKKGPHIFYCADTDGIKIRAGSGDTIRIGASASSAAGYVKSVVIGSWLWLYAIDADQWVCIGSGGTWTIDA